MCSTCGCSTNITHTDHHHDDAEHHHHDHVHGTDGAMQVTNPARRIAIEEDILSHNAEIAAKNRARFIAQHIFTLNLVSSPGAGKTSLLVETLRRIEGNAAVIEGDQETSVDAARIRETGHPAFQINTGRGCHLDAEMVEHACDHLDTFTNGFLFIENVGNLVCPAGFDLGEALRVVIASVTEGDDKPLKYPHIFASADLVIISKADLLPHLDCNIDTLLTNARRVNPRIASIVLSARTGDGMDKWLQWLNAARAMREAAA